ncbi:MAG: 50S ribosomal protein L37ae [Candidatus Bathyarchaeota archaeon]|nr:MAG: 50S ribosomal protein L37ae [Candidatus Bathyarchaeota archaeon]
MPRRKKSYGLRLRTRGGMSVRKQWTRINMSKRLSHKCPRCTSPSVKRDSVGIWDCAKCGYRFTGGAYIPTTRVGQASQRIR